MLTPELDFEHMPMMECRKYSDRRMSTILGGREYDHARYDVRYFTMNRNRVFSDGAPVSFNVTIRERDSLELVAAFSAQTGA